MTHDEIKEEFKKRLGMLFEDHFISEYSMDIRNTEETHLSIVLKRFNNQKKTST